MRKPIVGYLRPDGSLGVRNHIAIIYTVGCSEVVARRIASLFPGTQVFGIPQGCQWFQARVDKIIALGRHPNVAGALVVGLGCEKTQASFVAGEIAKTGKPAEAVVIQEVGGDLRTIQEGSRIVAKLLQHASQAERAELALSELIVCAECGGSDATSGLTSNPIVGVAADRIVAAGGTFIMEETAELLGCEEVLAQRAASPAVAQDIREVILEVEANCRERGWFSIGLGNIEGGLTTIEEKSAGALAKAGTTSLKGVLHYYDRPEEKGLYIMNRVLDSATGGGDPQGIMSMAGCGAQVALFTTGCGSVCGGVVVPVIKVCGNPLTCSRLADNIDLDASPIMRGEKGIPEMGEELYQEILAVAAGKLTRAEVLGHCED